MSEKLKQAAKGELCQIRVPGVCNGDPATTVLCHLNGAGIARKHPDFLGAWGCSACHAWVDGGYVKTHTRDERDLIHLQGVARTQQLLYEMGLLKIA